MATSGQSRHAPRQLTFSTWQTLCNDSARLPWRNDASNWHGSFSRRQPHEQPCQGGTVSDCERCGEPICKHGVCWCDGEHDGHCSDCSRRAHLEYEAEREANFQKNVAGPLLGFTESDKGKP